MDPHDIVEQLLSLPDLEAQKDYLAENAPSLPDGLASALKERADSLVRSDIRRALEVAELIRHYATLSGNPLDTAEALLAEGNARFAGLGEYAPAIQLYDGAAEIYRHQGRPGLEARSQVGKLGALANLGRCEEAIQVGEEISAALHRHGETRALATLLMNLGGVHGLAGNDARSLEMFDSAEALCRELGLEGTADWMSVQQNRSVALRNLGRFEEAIELGQQVSDGLERLGYTAESARARQSVALTYLVLGRYNEALELLDEVRDVFVDDGRARDAMMVELFTSDCLLQLRRFGDVLEKCKRARDLFAELGMRRAVAQAIVNEGVAYAQLGRYDQALASLAEARQLFEAEGNTALAATTDLETATVLLRKGYPERSLELAELATDVFAARELPLEQAQAYLVAARAESALGRAEPAAALGRAALAVAHSHSVPALKYQVHHLLGSLSAVEGDHQGALAEYDLAIEAVEGLRHRLMVEFQVRFAEDKEIIYEDAVDLCLEIGRAADGLNYAERAKSRALLDLVAYRLDLGVRAREARDEPLVEELVGLRVERDRLCRRWEVDSESTQRGLGAVPSQRAEADQAVLILEKKITALWHRLLVRNAGYARDAAMWTVRTEPVQPFLTPGTALVEYYGVHGSPVAFLVTPDAIEARRLDCDLVEVQQLLQLLWLNLRAVPKSAMERVSFLDGNARGLLVRLHDLLWAPLSDVLGLFDRIIVVPHGPLHYLPFQALHDGESYLVQRHTISHLPGASFLRYCSEASSGSSRIVSFGNSCEGRLPYAVLEAQSVANLMEGQAFVESEATRSRLCQISPACRLVHLATHGDFRPDNPLFSGLQLADGWLATLDIFNLRLDASLVTLSGCRTGRSVVGGGDELLGLMRAFLSAGAVSLLLSLWSVGDASTALLMESFYRRLQSGGTKAEALRGAQLDLLGEAADDGQHKYAHPYYWAPFFLVGDGGAL
jgi:tetratricopeptide (TPR) repeat protein